MKPEDKKKLREHLEYSLINADFYPMVRAKTILELLDENERLLKKSGQNSDTIECPFCLDEGYDLPGLAAHLSDCEERSEAFSALIEEMNGYRATRQALRGGEEG